MTFAAIASPSSNSIELGPLTFNYYGLAIAFGVLAGVWLAQKRWSAVGGGPEDISRLAMWVVPAGLVGARLYYLTTDWRYDDGIANAFKIWEGGLGIPGGVAAGALTVWWFARREGWDVPKLLDAAAPGLPLAQAIGRFGNWFNQELFGGPSDLPWAVEISPENRPPEYLNTETFQPTFFYESLWNFGLAAFLIWVGTTTKIRKGSLFAVYILGYLIARLWLETVRIDEATLIGGLRVNTWMSGIGIVLAGGWLLIWGRADNDGDEDGDADGVDDDSSDDTGADIEQVEMTSSDDGAS
jgi:phosphatidylglycerol---prolipoprotein diacylglyceryl transferase